MVVEQFKKLWLPRGVDFMIVPELSADHCRSTEMWKMRELAKMSMHIREDEGLD